MTVTAIENGLWEVTVTIVNRKLIPTHAAIDQRHGVTPPNRATLAGDGASVLAALTSSDPHFEQAEVVRRHPHDVRLANIPSMRPVYVRWIVRGEGPYTAFVRSAKGGVAVRVQGGTTPASGGPS
jgi:hypothetical protein